MPVHARAARRSSGRAGPRSQRLRPRRRHPDEVGRSRIETVARTDLSAAGPDRGPGDVTLEGDAPDEVGRSSDLHRATQFGPPGPRSRGRRPRRRRPRRGRTESRSTPGRGRIETDPVAIGNRAEPRRLRQDVVPAALRLVLVLEDRVDEVGVAGALFLGTVRTATEEDRILGQAVAGATPPRPAEAVILRRCMNPLASFLSRHVQTSAHGRPGRKPDPLTGVAPCRTSASLDGWNT